MSTRGFNEDHLSLAWTDHITTDVQDDLSGWTAAVALTSIDYTVIMRLLILLFLTACVRNTDIQGAESTPSAELDSDLNQSIQPAENTAVGERIRIESLPQDPTPEGFRLPATLLLPKGEPASAPCVVFIAGSGPTDRDWTSPSIPGKNGSGKQLAEALYKEGIGSIRYDKAAIADSDWPIADTVLDLYRDEALLAWRHMTDQAVCGTVSFLGNSEGSLHSFRAGVTLQESPRFGGVIGLSGPAMSLLTTVKVQLKAQLPADADMDAVDEQLDDLESRIRKLPEMDGPPLLSLIPGAASIWMAAINPLQGQLVRDLLLFEPLDPVVQYTGPALILAADHDIQVPPSEATTIFAALAPSGALRKNVLINNANHVYKHETRSREDADLQSLVLAYASDDVPLAEGVVEVVRDFLVALNNNRLTD